MIYGAYKKAGGKLRLGLGRVLAVAYALTAAIVEAGPSEPRVKYEQVVLPSEVVSFISAKEAEAQALAEKQHFVLSEAAKKLFATAKAGKMREAQGAFDEVWEQVSRPSTTEGSQSSLFQIACEVSSCVNAYGFSEPEMVKMLARELTNSLTPGCIYFGGTDFGRGLPTMLSKSSGEPFFVLTQNALSDKRYLGLIRERYASRIKLPEIDEIQKFVDEYTADATKRQADYRLAPGEDFRMEDGKPKFEGQVSVMKIHGLMTKAIFERNRSREFFVEESFPLDWMYPYLTPTGAIMRLNRQPMPRIPPDIMDRDHQFWTNLSSHLIGNWITYDTPIKEIANFAEKTYVRKDLKGFRGDPKCAADDQMRSAFAKLRVSIAGVYAWRLGRFCPPEFRPNSEADMRRLYKEADFGFRQAFAFFPSDPEVVFRYVSLLIEPPPTMSPRLDDAILVAKTSLASETEKRDFTSRDQMKDLISRLENFREQSRKK
jgi:hypothetical protein